MPEQQTWTRIIQVIAGVAGGLGVVLALSAFFSKPFVSGSSALESLLVQTAEMQRTKQQLLGLQDQIRSLETKIQELSTVSDEAKVHAQLTNVESAVQGLQGRFTKIEDLIVQEPVKALEIPLLRKDLDAIKEANQLSIAAIRQDLERAYTFLVATIFALAIAVLAPAVSNLFVKKPQPSEK